MEVLTLRGHLSVAACDGLDRDYSLLLCTHLPDGKRDWSARDLLARMPPHMELADPEESTLNLPYDLLITMETAKADFAAGRLGTNGVTSDRGYAEATPAVCNARLTYAKRGNRGTPARQAYWRDTMAELAGKWIEVSVMLHRYSFPATDLDGRPVRRVGTRLVIQSAEPLRTF